MWFLDVSILKYKTLIISFSWYVLMYLKIYVVINTNLINYIYKERERERENK